MTNNQDIQKKAVNALAFLRNHPAINPEVMGDSIFDGMWFHMAKCCKRGYCYESRNMTTIWRSSKEASKFKAQFEEEYKDDDCPKELQSITVTYKERFGEAWKFDHVEYWYETTFFIYLGNPYGNFMDHMDYKKWGRYGGPMSGANTFEEMIIKCARSIKKAYGNFNLYDDFKTTEEINNHKATSAFRNLKSNKEHMEVNNGLLNLRWLKWFVETDYCKKNWDFNEKEFRGYVKKLDRIPKKRAELIEKYKDK